MNRGKRRRARLAFLTSITLFGAAYGIAPAAMALTKSNVHAVTIEAMKFSPETIEVAEGDSVVWTNKDPFPHTVAAADGSFRSNEIAPNESWEITARKSGTVTYACTLHPTMTGSVVVRK
jgi:plastocyanin